MVERTSGNKMSVMSCISPDVYYEIEARRRLAKRSTYIAYLLEQAVFNNGVEPIATKKR